MSDSPSTQHYRITRPCFRISSPCRAHYQAPLCPCTHHAISIRIEGTFGRLRYLLGGDRPSQTAHLTLSPDQFHGARLEPQLRKGGISLAPPPRPKSGSQRVPPILRNPNRNPIPSYSKAPRGLSVLPREASVFTGNSISPSPPSRQRFLRYAIHAGRNLPDKEFRYLRTVIVTAAVYWGLSSKPLPPYGGITSPRDLPAPGKRQALYIIL